MHQVHLVGGGGRAYRLSLAVSVKCEKAQVRKYAAPVLLITGSKKKEKEVLGGITLL